MSYFSYAFDRDDSRSCFVGVSDFSVSHVDFSFIGDSYSS